MLDLQEQKKIKAEYYRGKSQFWGLVLSVSITIGLSLGTLIYGTNFLANLTPTNAVAGVTFVTGFAILYCLGVFVGMVKYSIYSQKEKDLIKELTTKVKDDWSWQIRKNICGIICGKNK
ncbi:hypothetical protein HYV43_03885 [Candidatus Micrarchaeota archaeon]|nr:hypothetical protein [Candidatus Micrarchaeota archaeon]